MKKSSYILAGIFFVVVCGLSFYFFDGFSGYSNKSNAKDSNSRAYKPSHNDQSDSKKRNFSETDPQSKIVTKDQYREGSGEDSLYAGYSDKVRRLLLELAKPLTEGEGEKYKEQVDEANNFAFSDYNIYSVESLKQLSESGDDYASRALVNRVSKEDAERYAQRSIKAGHLMYSAIALRLILDKETRAKAYAYLLLGYKNGDMIAKKSIRVHLNSIPTTEEEFEAAIEYVPTIEQQISEL